MWQFGLAFGDDCDSFSLRKTIGSWIDKTINSGEKTKSFGTKIVRRSHHPFCPKTTKFVCPEPDCHFATRGTLVLHFHIGEKHQKQYFRDFIHLYSSRK